MNEDKISEINSPDVNTERVHSDGDFCEAHKKDQSDQNMIWISIYVGIWFD